MHKVINAPKIERIYLSVGTLDEVTMTLVLNRSNYSILDTIYGISSYYPSFLSSDESYLYTFESNNGRLELVTIQTSSNSVVNIKPVNDIGPNVPYKGPETGSDGIALMSYQNGISEAQVEYYMTYDVATSTNLPSFPFPWIGDAYLSSNGDHIILNERIPVVTDSAAHEGYDEYPGIIYVYNAKTGQLTQRLSLPPGGKILTFPNYPHMFYYYNDSTNQAVPISDTVVTPTGALIDTLISLKHQAVAKGWLKDDRNRGHDI
ncbi:MAG: hypothetical protein M1339_04475, partial [Bacteroidetes bacterium]|nr:hypothetical protein [Bacteroidota bacterium]